VGYTVLVPTIFAVMATATPSAPSRPIPLSSPWSRSLGPPLSPRRPGDHCDLLALHEDRQRVGVITLRLCVAVLMGLTISHPDHVAPVPRRRHHGDRSGARQRDRGHPQDLRHPKGCSRKQTHYASSGVDKQRKLYDESFEAKFVKSGPIPLPRPLSTGTLNAEQATSTNELRRRPKATRQELADLATRIKTSGRTRRPRCKPS